LGRLSALGLGLLTLAGKVVATAAIYPSTGELPETAHVILHLD
jgi:hypothetical protein